jgi:hypothetical protein
MRWGAYGCTGAGSRLYPALNFRREKGGHPQLGIVLLSDPHPPFCQFEAGYHVHCFGRLKANGWPLSQAHSYASDDDGVTCWGQAGFVAVDTFRGAGRPAL